MLELAARGTLHVRREPSSLGVRLLYVSDLHLLPWHGYVVDQVLARVRETAPDLVLLGGDLVDLPSGLPLLRRLVERLEVPFEAVAGNHDRFVGLDLIQGALGRPWLSRVVVGQAVLDGAPRPGGHVLVAHDPGVFREAAHLGYRFVLAGHLHGSQFVLGQSGGLLYPGAWFYRWNGDRFEQDGCTMLVSRGVNDTLPLRWNCPRDVILLGADSSSQGSDAGARWHRGRA